MDAALLRGRRRAAVGRVGVAILLCLPCLMGLLAPAAGVMADVIQSTISAVGTAEEAGTWDGYLWYRYTYTVTWSDFDHGLSHMSLLQLAGCAEPDHLYLFPMARGEACDGQSTDDGWEVGDSVEYTVLYAGGFIRTGGDPSLEPDVSPPELPVVKYEPFGGGAEPGKSGVGEFSFIANIEPATGTHEDVVVAKHSGDVAVGDLAGAYPRCTVTPEPATMALLGIGLGILIVRHRRT